MRRFLFASVALLIALTLTPAFLSTSVEAQEIRVRGLRGPICPGSGALCQPIPSYTGPGDLVSGWFLWGGLRAFSAGTAGGNAIDIQRNSDASTCIGVKTNAQGNLDLTVGTPCGGSTVTSFCASTTCTITKIYDQSGNGHDLIQGTVAKQPTLVFNCIGSQPCMAYSAASNQQLAGGGFITVNQPMTVVAVANQTSNSGQHVLAIGANSGEDYVGFSITDNNAECGAGSTLEDVSLTDGTWGALQCLANGTSSSFTVNGSTTAFSGGTGGISGQTLLSGTNAGGSAVFTGKIAEIGISTTAFSGANLSAMNTNMRSYWGF